MPSLHREIAQLIQKELCPGPQEIVRVLVLGSDEEKFVDVLSGLEVATASPPNGQLLANLRENEDSWRQSCNVVVASDSIAFCQLRQPEELSAFFRSLLSLLRNDGLLFFKEDLSQGDLSIAQCTDMMDRFRTPSLSEDGSHGLKLRWAICLQSAIRERQSWSHVCWCLEKTKFDELGSESVREFLDKKQYSDAGILAYEAIFGKGFISPGGKEENAHFVSELGLEPGDRVLDVGCGIGGNAHFIATEYGSDVLGIDLSSNMISIAADRATQAKDTRLSFMIADVTQFDFPADSFDAIYSRDCIIHIEDKKALFARFLKWLKPNGKLLLTDYNVGEKAVVSPDFKEYVADRQYTLRTIPFYISALKEAGFVNVKGRDITPRFREILEEELNKVTTVRESFSEEKFRALVDGWRNKLSYIECGDQKWGVFSGIKPPSSSQT